MTGPGGNTGGAGDRSWNRSTDELLYKALTGKTAPRVQDTGVRSIRGLVKQLGGTKAAAQSLGVSARTVQRWTTANAAKRAKPSAASQQKITSSARALRDRKLANVGSSRTAQRRIRNGARLSVTGGGGPSYESKGRPWIEIELSPDEVEQLYDSVAQYGGGAETQDLINNFYERHYMGNPDADPNDPDAWTWKHFDGIELN